MAEDLIGQLRRYLGKSGFDWLCALAAYPSIRPDLTRELARKVEHSEGGSSLFDEQDYLFLSRLPWVSRGRMPNWLRRKLLLIMEPWLAERVEKALFELMMENKDPDCAAVELPSRDRQWLGLLWRALSIQAPAGSAIRDIVLIEFVSGKLRKVFLRRSGFDELLHKLGWRIWPSLIAFALIVVVATLRQDAAAAILPWFVNSTALVIVVASLVASLFPQSSPKTIGLLAAFGIAFTFFTYGGGLQSVWRLVVPSATFSLCCGTIARLSLGDGDYQASDLLRSEEPPVRDSPLTYLIWVLYGIFFCLLSQSFPYFMTVYNLDLRTIWHDMPIVIYFNLTIALFALGLLLRRKLHSATSFRIALGAAAVYQTPACIAAAVAGTTWLMISMLMDPFKEQLWWAGCLVSLIWGAILSVLFTRLGCQPRGNLLVPRSSISAGLEGGALVLPVMVVAVLSQFSYVLKEPGELKAGILVGCFSLLSLTINPLVIWSSCLRVITLNRLAGVHGASNLLVKLHLFLLRPPTIAIAAMIGLGWLAGVHPNKQEPNLLTILAIVSSGAIIITYDVARALNRLLDLPYDHDLAREFVSKMEEPRYDERVPNRRYQRFGGTFPRHWTN